MSRSLAAGTFFTLTGEGSHVPPSPSVSSTSLTLATQHCSLLRWFEHQPVCPLCKTKKTSGFTRELLAPNGADNNDEARGRQLSAMEPAEVVAHRLSAALECCVAEHDSLIGKRQACSALIEQRRMHVKRLQTGLLDAKRASLRAEQAQGKQKGDLQQFALSDAAAAEAWARAAGAGDAAGMGVPDAAGSAADIAAPRCTSPAKEVILNQNRQLQWRCDELRQLEGKVEAIRSELHDAGWRDPACSASAESKGVGTCS